ncbi:MAG: T9SS type A sorting domain-containing protein [Bacteroidales bacterium]
MKKYSTLVKWCILFVATMLNYSLITTQAQKEEEFETFIFEDFENDGERPQGWTEQFVSGSRTWRYEDGGYAPTGAPNFRHPPHAYSGSYNALFQDESVGPMRRLITPSIDLRTAIKPTLVFWHAQDEWDNSTDELKVYYSTTKNPYNWVELEHYDSPVASWTKREIILPDDVKVQDCYIAFEGISNWGWGVCIDDVAIEERGLLQRTVESFGLRQYNATFPSGSNINQFSFISALVSGNTGDIPVNSITLSYTGTDINDLANVRLFHTRDSIFNITTPIPSDVSINGDEITLTAPTFNLFTGENYIWVCFDINSSVDYGNSVNFTLNSNSVQLGSTTFPSTTLNPSQSASIHTSILFDDFTDISDWTTTGDWEIGEPLGTGSFDPDYAYYGANVLATNLNGNYSSGITSDNPHTAISESVDAKYYQNLSVRYKRWLNIEYFDKTSVKLSNDGESSWINLFASNSDILDRRWRRVAHNIAPYATRKEDVKIQFSIDTTNKATEYGGWNVDNFAVTGEFIHTDVGVKTKLLPIQQCGLTSSETVTVIIKNYGGATINDPFEVGYSLNGGSTYIKELFNDPIESEEEIEFTFATPADLSSPGQRNLVFRTFLDDDQDPGNNAYNENIYVFPTITLPYQASFENSSSYWYASGNNSSWRWGKPNGTVINSASDGIRAWATSLTQNYNNNEFSYLESPCFDLTGAEYPVFSFDYIMDIEEGVDGLTIEYSIDEGSTWNTLEANVNYAYNWFDTETVDALSNSGWSVNQSSYITAKTLLPNDIIGEGSVKFRFVFASDALDTYEGVAIDMIRIYELPYDLGITKLLSPDDDCEIGNNVNLELRITNHGYRPLPVDHEIPVNVQVDQGDVKSETITYSAAEPLEQNSTYDFTTSNTFNIFNAGTHDILAYTNLTNDDDRLNDTLIETVEVYGMPNYNIGSNIGTMQPDTVVIDAGQGYTSYTWYEFNDPNWDEIVGETNYQYNVDEYGSYKVLVENNLGCTATDSVTIAASEKDVGVSNINNIEDECTNPDPIYPEVNLKFHGITAYDGIENFPVIFAVNGEVVIEEVVTPNENWGVVGREDSTYVFSSPIDLSEVESYLIKAYTDLSNDLSRSNDTSEITVNTWGEPQVKTSVNIGSSNFQEVEDDIITTRPDTLILQATSGFINYEWEQQIKGQTSWSSLGENSNTLSVDDVSNNLVSAFYRVTAEADHGCGQDMDTVFVNSADLSISSIVSPAEIECEVSEPTPLTIAIENVGYETYPAGTQIQVDVQTPFGEQNETLTLSEQLINNQEIHYTFPQSIQFPIGEHYLNFTIETDNDPNPDNDSKDILSIVNPSPWVTIEPDSLFKVFGSDEDYTITPSYSDDAESYLWHDGTMDPNYLVWGPPLYSNYKVVVENSHECSASDSLIIISHDLDISNIVSPANDCELEDNTPVTFTLMNTGNQTYPIGTQIDVSLYLDGTIVTTETIELPTNLASNSSIDLTLTQTLDLAESENATLQIDFSTDIVEVDYDNNSQNKTIYALGYPEITLGEDRDVFAWEEILDPGYFDDYLWQDESTDRTYTATEDGTYHVTVTDFSGCQAYAEVTLTFHFLDIEIINIDEPISGCGLGSEEPITITFKNSGDYVLEEGTVLNLGFTLGETNYSEELTLEQSFDIDDVMTVTLGETVDLSEPTTHNMQIWVEAENDMIPENSNIAYAVDSYPEVDFSLNLPDEIETYDPITLDAGAGYVSYLWHDGSTDQTYLATESGLHHVTVTDENGCTGYDEVYIEFRNSDLNVTEVISPATEECRIPDMPIEITIKNEREQTLDQGEELDIFCIIGFETPYEFTETFTLPEALAPNDEINYVFNQTANLTSGNSYQFTFRVDYDGVDGDVHIHNSNINPTPNVNLGDEIIYVDDDSYTLVADVSGTYLWSTGSTASQITVYETGEYWLQVTNSYGCTASDTVYVDFGNWTQQIPGTNTIVSVYPNPVNEKLTVRINPQRPSNIEMQLVSPVGQTVFQKKEWLDGLTTIQLNVTNLSPGVYLLRVMVDGGWAVTRVVVGR